MRFLCTCFYNTTSDWITSKICDSISSLITSHFVGWCAALWRLVTLQFWDITAELHQNWDNHTQNFHLGRYIVGYTFGNHVLRLRLRVTVKLNFRPYIRRYTSQNETFEYGNPLNVLLCSCLSTINPSWCELKIVYGFICIVFVLHVPQDKRILTKLHSLQLAST